MAKKQDSSGDDSGCQGELTASESTSPIRATRMRREGEEKEKKNKRAPSPSVLLTSNRLPRNQKYLPHPSPTGMKPRMPGAARACSGRHFFGWPPPWLQGFGHMDLGLLSRLAHASIFLEPLLKFDGAGGSGSQESRLPFSASRWSQMQSCRGKAG